MTECVAFVYFERVKSAATNESRNLFPFITGSLDSPFDSFAFRSSSHGSLEMWGALACILRLVAMLLAQDDKRQLDLVISNRYIVQRY